LNGHHEPITKKTGAFCRQGAWRERKDMPRSAKTAIPKKPKRISPKKPKRAAPRTAKRTAPKRITRAAPKTVKRGTRAPPKKTGQTSVAAMQARIDALEAEIRKSRDEQTAAAEILQTINSKPGDLTLVFDAILEKAMRLCDASFGGLWLFEDGDRYIS